VPDLVLHAPAAEAVVEAAMTEVSAPPVSDEQVLAPFPIGVQVAVAAQTVFELVLQALDMGAVIVAGPQVLDEAPREEQVAEGPQTVAEFVLQAEDIGAVDVAPADPMRLPLASNGLGVPGRA